VTSSCPAATPDRLHAKRIIAWRTPFIPQDKSSFLTHRKGTQSTNRRISAALRLCMRFAFAVDDLSWPLTSSGRAQDFDSCRTARSRSWTPLITDQALTRQRVLRLAGRQLRPATDPVQKPGSANDYVRPDPTRFHITRNWTHPLFRFVPVPGSLRARSQPSVQVATAGHRQKAPHYQKT